MASTSEPTKDTEKDLVTDNEKYLAVSFVRFLREKQGRGDLAPETQENLELAIQCLEGALGLTDLDFAFQSSRPLFETFCLAEGLSTESQKQIKKEQDLPESKSSPTESELQQAQELKNQGNKFMQEEKFEEAIQKYTEAMRLDSHNPAFFCNRAAAYSKKNQHDLAIQDCRTALAIDPNYGKACGRMGLALASQNRYTEAVDAYKRAYELDPENESFANNLKLAEEKLAEQERQAQAHAAADPFQGMMGNMGQMLNNPQMMQMAASMMQNPNVQSFVTEMMQSLGAPPPPGGRVTGGDGGPEIPAEVGAHPPPPSGSDDGIANLMRMGQQMAQQMYAANPDLVDQMRQVYGVPPTSQNQDESPQDPSQNRNDDKNDKDDPTSQDEKGN